MLIIILEKLQQIANISTESEYEFFVEPGLTTKQHTVLGCSQENILQSSVIKRHASANSRNAKKIKKIQKRLRQTPAAKVFFLINPSV